MSENLQTNLANLSQPQRHALYNKLTSAVEAAHSERLKGLPDSVRELIDACPGLTLGPDGSLRGGDAYRFVKVPHDREVAPPATLPSLAHGDDIYFVVPATADLKDWHVLVNGLLPGVAREAEGFTPADDEWPPDDDIDITISKHNQAVYRTRALRDANKLLEAERSYGADLFASAVRTPETAPMMVEGLFRDIGVSVIWGRKDEFKTTIIRDLAAHVALGLDWQGGKVRPRPVIVHALECGDDFRFGIQALEARLKGKSALWGDNERAPIKVFENIPEDALDWRREIYETAERFRGVREARLMRGEMPSNRREYVNLETGKKSYWDETLYPEIGTGVDVALPLVIVDTLSIWLNSADEKGPRVAEYVRRCLDLIKPAPHLATDHPDDETDEECRENNPYLEHPVASHVMILAHSTKSGGDIAGHPALVNNTSGSYRVEREGKFGSGNRSNFVRITPERVKGIALPVPMRFEVEIAPVPDTQQGAPVLKSLAAPIPEDLLPVIAEIRKLEDHGNIAPDELNECLDVVAGKGGRDGSTKRMARSRCRDALEAAGVLEPLEDDNGKLTGYCFHDPLMAR